MHLGQKGLLLYVVIEVVSSQSEKPICFQPVTSFFGLVGGPLVEKLLWNN
jgi:hypothetical protein